MLTPEYPIFVSLITFWEISLKYSLGKLELQGVTPGELPGISEDSGFETLQLSAEDVSTFHKLPRQQHKDPFDRLIIWQAINNDLHLISKDSILPEYKEAGLSFTW